MDDEFYTIGDYIAHKSCIFDGTYFSNSKYVYVYQGIDHLKQKCVIIDKINENIDVQIHSILINQHCKFPWLTFYGPNIYIELYCDRFMNESIEFESYEEFYDYMYKHYPHLIKSHDIKIALKD